MIHNSHLKIIHDLIGHSRWYIAGGSIVSMNYSDIDIFFYNIEDAKAALTNKNLTRYDCYDIMEYHTRACTYQFICFKAAPIMDMLAGFDLNKSRKAMDSFGNIIVHPTFNEPLYIDEQNIRSNTFIRYIKYALSKNFDPSVQHLEELTQYLLDNQTTKFALAYAGKHSVTGNMMQTGLHEYLCTSNQIHLFSRIAPLLPASTFNKVWFPYEYAHLLSLEYQYEIHTHEYLSHNHKGERFPYSQEFADLYPEVLI